MRREEEGGEGGEELGRMRNEKGGGIRRESE